VDISGVLAKHARHRPDHVAVVFGQRRVGYGEFHRRTNRVANAFGAIGVAKGDKVATFLSNSLELLEVYWAAAKIGETLRGGAAALRLSGPAPAPLERIQGRWRFQILLRAVSRAAVLEALEAGIPERAPAGVQVAVDVDPQDLM